MSTAERTIAAARAGAEAGGCGGSVRDGTRGARESELWGGAGGRARFAAARACGLGGDGLFTAPLADGVCGREAGGAGRSLAREGWRGRNDGLAARGDGLAERGAGWRGRDGSGRVEGLRLPERELTFVAAERDGLLGMRDGGGALVRAGAKLARVGGGGAEGRAFARGGTLARAGAVGRAFARGGTLARDGAEGRAVGFFAGALFDGVARRFVAAAFGAGREGRAGRAGLEGRAGRGGGTDSGRADAIEDGRWLDRRFPGGGTETGREARLAATGGGDSIVSGAGS